MISIVGVKLLFMFIMKLVLLSWSGISYMSTLCPLFTAWALAASIRSAWLVGAIAHPTVFATCWSSSTSPRGMSHRTSLEESDCSKPDRTSGPLATAVDSTCAKLTVLPAQSSPLVLSGSFHSHLGSWSTHRSSAFWTSLVGSKAPCTSGDLHFGNCTVISFTRGGFAIAIPSKLPARQGLRRAVSSGGGAKRCHARSMSKGVILQNPHTLHVSKAEAQRVD